MSICRIDRNIAKDKLINYSKLTQIGAVPLSFYLLYILLNDSVEKYHVVVSSHNVVDITVTPLKI